MILNLSNFIHSLLVENETVIIPGFGAFISTYKPAEISENEINPPSKEISFTQQIKNNDGLLVEIIARKAKISQVNALKRIEKARENMFYELDKGETVILENIGKLYYNKNNEIQFIPFQEDNLLLDSFGLEAVSMEDSIEKMDKIEPKPAIETIVEEIITDDRIVIIPEIEKDIEKDIGTDIEDKAKPFKLPEFQLEAKHEKRKERKKIGWYWYLLILVPFLIGGYFLINNISESDKDGAGNEQYIRFEQEGKQVEKLVNPDSIQNEPVQITEADSTLNVVPETKLTQETEKYYLVGGGFENEENAQNYILQLKEKGIEGFLFGKKGKLFLVGIESFNSEEEALKSLNEHFIENPKWKLWIYKK